MLSICMFCKPLDLILQSCIKHGEFLTESKNPMLLLSIKKVTNRFLKNYRSVSLLPRWGKIFERLLYNRLYEYFVENELISSSQSGFKPGDLCINQLLSITHGIYQSFDNGFEVRGVFHDISKAFDKMFGIKVLSIS